MRRIANAAVNSANGFRAWAFSNPHLSLQGLPGDSGLVIRLSPPAPESLVALHYQSAWEAMKGLVNALDTLSGQWDGWDQWVTDDVVNFSLINCKPAQLQSYNKIRKPVDLYIEHLVAMAVELEEARAKLAPLLFLQLDSQILAHPGLFTDKELAEHGLTRKSTYKSITAERTYVEIQDLLAHKAATVAESMTRAFHVIYFDLVWNDRYRNWGSNLFETNP